MRQILMVHVNIPASTLSIDARDFFKKALMIRAKLLAAKKGNCSAAMIAEFSAAKNWFNHWAPNSRQCAAYIIRHQDRIKMILPGEGSCSHDSLLQSFNSIITCYS